MLFPGKGELLTVQQREKRGGEGWCGDREGIGAPVQTWSFLSGRACGEGKG